MTPQVYFDDFENWDAVVSSFDPGVPAHVEDVIFALYEREGYEGTAYVIYYDQGKYYLNYGSHCSCYGLEGQWSPDEYASAEELKKCVINHIGTLAKYTARINHSLAMQVRRLKRRNAK
jgi:hypothetical protein